MSERTTITVVDTGKRDPWQKPGSNQFWYTIAAEGYSEPIRFVQDRDKGAPSPVLDGKYQGTLYDDDGKLKFYPSPQQTAQPQEASQRQQAALPVRNDREESIERQSALKSAVTLLAGIGTPRTPEEAMQVAEQFYGWLRGDAQAAVPSQPQTGYQRAQAMNARLKQGKASIGNVQDAQELDEGEQMPEGFLQ